MDYIQSDCKISRKDSLSAICYSFWIDCKDIANLALQGQFIHIKVEGFTLRRPISICEIDKERGRIRIVFEIRGKGTKQLALTSEGDFIDIIAPLGRGFTLYKTDTKVIVIGGGIGVPPLLQLAKYYGKNATAIIGFQDRSRVILQDDFIKTNAKNILCTNDGSAGMKGYVTDALIKEMQMSKPDIIYVCGPSSMIKAVVEMAIDNGVNCEVSLEERMACGVGACLVCACKAVKNGEEYFAHVCKDGPVFDAREVIF